MTARRIPIRSGPLEGAVAVSHDPPSFAWIGSPPPAGGIYTNVQPGEEVRCWRVPTRHRQLYHYTAEGYEFAGNTYRLCPGCGAFHGKAAACTLCGATLV